MIKVFSIERDSLQGFIEALNGVCDSPEGVVIGVKAAVEGVGNKRRYLLEVTLEVKSQVQDHNVHTGDTVPVTYIPCDLVIQNSEGSPASTPSELPVNPDIAPETSELTQAAPESSDIDVNSPVIDQGTPEGQEASNEERPSVSDCKSAEDELKPVCPAVTTVAPGTWLSIPRPGGMPSAGAVGEMPWRGVKHVREDLGG